MGLDQYVEVKDEDGQWCEYKYYRKFYELQGWFEENHSISNLGKVILTVDIIKALIDDIEEGDMKETQEFFYGDYKAYEEQWEDLLCILYELIDMVEDGDKARYTCSY